MGWNLARPHPPCSSAILITDSFTHVNSHLKQAIEDALCMIFHIFQCIAVVLDFNKGLTAAPICGGCECRLSSPWLVGRPPAP